MSAKKLLDLLDKNGLLDEVVMAELRQQVADGKGKVTAETIAKALVDKGHLTKFLATKLVGEATAGTEEPPVKKPDDDDLLELVPYEGQPPGTVAASAAKPEPKLEAKPEPKSSGKAAKGAKTKPDRPEVEEVVMLEDADALTPVVDAGAGLTPINAASMVPAGLTPMGGFDAPLSEESTPSDHGGLSALDAADPFATPARAGGQPKKVGKQLVVARQKETQWDTKLVLGGGGFLLFLVGLGVVLWIFITSQPAGEMLKAADDAYNGANYSDAKTKYEAFVKAYPDEPNDSSKARVRIILCQLRTAIADPERGLKSAEELLPKLDGEEQASLARDEFPGFLPAIPEGFVKRAQQAKDTATMTALVAQARKSRELLAKPEVIATQQRIKIQPQLTRIDEDIALLERSIAQDNDLKAAIAAIGSSVDGSDTIASYKHYTELLRKYPGLRNDVELNAAVGKITAREKQLVKVTQQPLTALTEEATSPSQIRIVLATRNSGDAKPLNEIATLIAGSSAYALDAGNGQVQWSRHIGFGIAQPVRVTPTPEADVLLVDSQRNELVCVKRDGKLIWRLPIGEPFTEPAVAGNKAFVATASGRVIEVNLESGNSTRHLTIKQRLAVSPVVSQDRPRLYQVGEHSNLYVINTQSMQCEDVIYLGHRSGSIVTPPLILMGHVFVAENPAAEFALVHPLRIRASGDGPKLFPTQDPIRTDGRIVVPLTAYGRRLLVLTDRGQMAIYDVDSAKNENSLAETGRLPASTSPPMMRYPLADGTTIWIADDRLTKYTAQITRKEISRDPAITNVGDTFVGPLKVFGSTLAHIRRPNGSTGVVVTGIHIDDPRKPLWTTTLGASPARITVDPVSNEIVAVTSGAALFRIDKTATQSGQVDKPIQSVATTSAGLSFSEPVDLENGIVAFFNPADQNRLLVYNPAIADARLSIVETKTATGAATCSPIAFAGGVLVPSDAGVVQLFKPADGSVLALPFQPKLEPNQKILWRRPTVLPGGQEFVIVDDQRNIFRVGIKDQPQPNLAESAANKLDLDVVGSLAATGDTVYGVVRGESGDVIVAISAGELKVVKQVDLKGARVTWGPVQVGTAVFVASALGPQTTELRVFEAGAKERWEKPAVMHGTPAGLPLVAGDNVVFASVPGSVWSLVAASGQEIGVTDVGEPLGAGPVAFRDRLLLCGHDGALHVIAMPSASHLKNLKPEKPEN